MTPLVDDVRTEGDHTDQRTRFGPWLGLRSTGLVAATGVIVVAAVIGLSNAGGNPLTGDLPPTATLNPLAASASVTDGDFRLTITSPKATWGTDEVIEVGTTLEYLGPEAEATLWGSLSRLIRFGVVEVSGDRIMGGEFAASEGPPGQRDCGPHVISAAANIAAPFSKGGVYDANDPNFDFYQTYLADPEFHLPTGQWQIIARATFDAGADVSAVGRGPAEDPCTATPTQMSVSITLTVEGSSEPSAEPSSAVPAAGPGSCLAPAEGEIVESEKFTPYEKMMAPPFRPPILEGGAAVILPPHRLAPTNALDGLPLQHAVGGETESRLFLDRPLDPTMTLDTFFAEGGISFIQAPVAPGYTADRLIDFLGERGVAIDVGEYVGVVTWADPLANGVRHHQISWSDGVYGYALLADRSAVAITNLARSMVCGST